MSTNLRENALNYLNAASTSDLLRLCASLRNWIDIEVRETEKLGGVEVEEAIVPASGARPSVGDAVDRTNTDPGWGACTRIGSETREKIHAILAVTSASLDNIAKSIKQKEASAQALLQLLWARGEIKYDAKEGVFYK